MPLPKKLFAALLIILPLAGSAQETYESSAFIQPEPYTKYEIASAFKYYKLTSPHLSVPSVVEIPFSQESFSLPVFAVYDMDISTFEPYLLLTNRIETKSEVEARATTGDAYLINPENSYAMHDGNYETYLEFPLYGYSGSAEIAFKFEKPITASSLFFALDDFVALPQKVSVSATVSGKDAMVLAPVKPGKEGVVFPKTTASAWRVTFDYVQPLRISEMEFNDMSVNQTINRNLRFLAQPGHTYQVYFDADRYVKPSEKETGDLFSGKNIIHPGASSSVPNSDYQPADSDSDGIPDLSDNCASVFNPDQKDGDENSRGDACEDYDRDAVLDGKDNCPEFPNFAQTDTDTDGIGDVCDSLDNRITERMPWLPWVGIGAAGTVLLVLFVIVLKRKPEDNP